MNNLDKILKEQMEQFAPEAPNVWAGIETGIKNNAGSSNAGSSNAAAGSKIGMGILKVLAIASLPAAFIAYSYFANPGTDNKQAVVTTQPTIKEQQQEPVSQPELITEPAQREITDNKATIVSPDNQKIKAHKKTTVAKELANNNSEALNTQASNNTNTQNQETTTNPTAQKTEAKTDNPQILQNELKDESNLNEEIESGKKEEEVEKPKEEIAVVTVKKFPNSFTPNNDGFNDKYLVEIEGEKYYNLKIYNTQNELLFESNDKSNNWDGTNFKTGQVCASGTYYGILIYKGADNANVKTLKTAIQLIR